MTKESNESNPIYKVDLYHLLGTSYIYDNSTCDVESLGKILVSVSNKDKNPYRDNAGECIEAIKGFDIPLIKCSMSSRFDGWYFENVTMLSLPYEYNYWDKYRLYIIRLEDIKESNLATLEDIKEYNPQKEIWYELLKEIREKGIDFDYEQEAIKEIYGEYSESVLKKKR